MLTWALLFFCKEGEKTEATKKLRASVSAGCENHIWKFFEEEGGQVVIYDANNGTRAQRATLANKFEKQGIHVIFLGMYEHSFRLDTVEISFQRADRYYFVDSLLPCPPYIFLVQRVSVIAKRLSRRTSGVLRSLHLMYV